MLFTPRTSLSTSAAIFIVVSVACMAASSSCEMCSTIPRPLSCECSNTPDGYELRCSAFTVQVKPKAVVHIRCDNNVISDFTVLSGMRIGEVDTLIIQLCPLPMVSLSQLMQNMGMSSVNNVHLSYTGVNGNSEMTVTRELFHGLSKVTSLTLHTDGTTILTDDVFTDMHNLIFIDLKINKLLLGKHIFCGVTKLQVLQLCSHNQTFLEPGVFYNLIHLRTLVLSGNMVTLSRSVFSDTKNLVSLDINSTKMNSLPSDLFVDLTKLENINLYENEFIRLPEKLFMNNSDLETVKIQDNRRTLKTLPRRMLADLTRLKIVKICNCNMSILPQDLLWGSASLHTISLNNNALSTLPENIFKDCTKLETLDISYNWITNLHNQIFSTVTNLKFLKINNNRLSVITKNLFLSLTNLVVLDLKNNRLTDIETDAFEMLYHLKAVDMSNNFLTFDESWRNGATGLSPLKHCGMLENIQLANNSLSKIFADWRNLENLETLNLAYNKISKIMFEDLKFTSVSNTFCNVSYNNISEMDIVHFDIVSSIIFITSAMVYVESMNSFSPYSYIAVKHIYLEGNLINCDCKVSTLFYKNDRIRQMATIIIETDSQSLQCSQHDVYTEKNVFLFLPFKPSTCLLKKEYWLNCPAECSCLLMILGKALVVDCNQKDLSSLSKQEDVVQKLSRSVFVDLNNLEFVEINSVKSSSLPSDLFQDLTKLAAINVYGSEFLSLPQNLFVNSRQLSVVTIEENRRTLDTLPPRFLGNLTKLDVVTLRSCNMSTLPEDLLWGSLSIKVFSLKNNAFKTLPELLFKDCTKLKVLDISYNKIASLPDGLLSGLTELYILNMSDNELSVIPKKLLLSLRMLLYIGLKNNRLTHTEQHAFVTLKHLRAVDMSNNMLTFEDALKRNTMSFSPLMFCNMLSRIELANNSLTKIFIDWRNLRHLEILNLAHNKISKLQAEDLDFIVSNNISVNISYNNISYFDIFDPKKVYKYISDTEIYNVPVRNLFVEGKGNPINCDCKIYRFLQYSGEDITAVINLSITTDTSSLQCVKPESHNLILGQGFEKILIKYFICLIKVDYSVYCPERCTCQLLKSIKAMVVECFQENLTSGTAGENVLLSRDFFFGENNLESFDFIANGLTTLTPDVFVDLIKLRKISLRGNTFFGLPQDLYVNNPDLEVINIENNGQTLETVPSGFFANLHKLKKVRLHSCNISTLPEDLMWGSMSINTISLRNNTFITLPQMLFTNCFELQYLDISFNRITDLPSYLFEGTRKLKILKINNNYLTLITSSLFSSLEKLEVLDLRYNRLTHIESHAFATLHSLKSVNMSNNMLTFRNTWSSLVSCPSLEDIQLANNSLTKMLSNLRNFDNLQTLNLAYNEISQLQADDLNFTSAKNIFVNVSYNSITDIVLFDTESDIKYVPKIMEYNVPLRQILTEGNPINCGCKIYRLLQYRGDIVTGEVKLIMETEPLNVQCIIPGEHTQQQSEEMPMKYFTCLSKNYHNLNCPEQCSCLFRIYDKALRVDCQDRNLTSMPEALPDTEFSIYTELNLSGNRIKSVKFPLGSGYYKVTKYILSDNKISEINLTAFSPKLQVLMLDKNRTKHFEKLSIEFLMDATSLAQLTLHNNPWICDCTAKDFVTLIKYIYDLRKITILDKITCESGKQLLQIAQTELCPVEPEGLDYVGYILVLLFGLLVGLLFACYYKFQNAIKVWLYAHRCCLCFVAEEELDKHKLYDAFISYAYQDESFVMDHLVPTLEDDDHYTLCFHQRDWIPGEFIQAQIVRSVEASRRTLIILSRAFLNSVWGIMEFRVAHEQAL